MSITNILKKVANAALKVVNDFIPKDAKSVFLFPNEGGAIDGYNITNYNSDNVLCLANSLLKDEKYNDYNLYIVYFKDEELEECVNYCKQYHLCRVHFVKFRFDMNFFRAYSKCKNVFIANDMRLASYKSFKQKVICLNYWIAPLKGSLYGVDKMPINNYIPLLKSKNRLIDCYVTTSDFCSWTISCARTVLLSKFVSLGFPRDDVFYTNDDCREEFYEVLGFVPQHIICFTPTHRDYENPNRKLFDGEKIHKRTLFGNTDIEQDAPLEELLEKTNSVMIIKSHYAQEGAVINKYNGKRFVYFSDLQKRMKISLHDILKITDVLINDYSTSFYDYLCVNKPIINYMFDYEEYVGSRSFWIKPIDAFIPGPIVKSFQGLIEILAGAINGEDTSEWKRAFIRDMVDKNQDGNSADRIKTYFFK